MADWSDVKREIKARASLPDMLARLGVKVTKNGRSGHATCLCPWHGDKDTPSLHVYPDHVHCFGCGCRGDVIDVYAYAEGLVSGAPPYTDLGEAFRRLAAELGVEMPAVSREWLERETRRRETARLYGDVARQAQEWLQDDFVGGEAVEYLRGRGFTDATIRDAGLGFWPRGDSSRVLADDGSDAVAAKDRKPYTFQQLRDAGLRAETQDGREYDVLASCIVFPVEIGGHVVYLTGRTLPTPEKPKRHVKLSNVYDGDRVRNPCPALYGLGGLPRDARRVFCVEGETDTLTLLQAGLPVAGRLGVSAGREEVVATLGRFPEAVVMFDSDPQREDGKEAASARESRELARALVGRSRILRVQYPARPDGTRPKDPNGYLQDLIRAGATVEAASAQVRDLITMQADAAPRALDWLLDEIATDKDPVTRARRVASEITPLMVAAAPAERGAMVDVVARKTGLTKGSLRDGLDAAVKAQAAEEKAKAAGVTTASVSDLVPGSYYAANGRMYWVTSGRDGPKPVCIANFEARITEQTFLDEGAEDESPQRSFVLEGRRHDGRPLPSVTIPAKNFKGLNWLEEAWGAGFCITPGPGMQSHVKNCIEQLSGVVPERRRYRHLGWRQIDGEWVYLHAGGGIGADGPVPGIEVEMQGAFRRYALSDPLIGAELVNAIRTHLQMLEVARLTVSAPLFCATWRAPLGPCDFSVFVVGRGGKGKSTMAALFQNAWGPEWDFEHFPANWSSTENILEKLTFAAKDCGMVIDDFAPSGARNDREKFGAKAERIFRAVGNQAGRQRMNQDKTSAATYFPRGLVVATGEDLPEGLGSMLARMLIVRVEPGSVHIAFEGPLAEAQAEAAAGTYARVMASYVKWLAPQMDDLGATRRERRDRIARTWSETASHLRIPRILGDLALGLEQFLHFAQAAGAIDSEQWQRLWTDCCAALTESAMTQAADLYHRDAEHRFLELIGAALASGKAHVARVDGTVPPPEIAGSWGWRHKFLGTSRYGGTPDEDWQALGERIGWRAGGNLYLLPAVAYAVAQDMGKRGGDGLAVTQTTLGKRMSEAKLLLSRDVTRETLTVRRICEGEQRSVWHLDCSRLSGLPEGVGGPDISETERIPEGGDENVG